MVAAVFGVKLLTNTHLFLGWWRWGLHYLLRNRLSITMTFKFSLTEFEDAREYNLRHILYSCMTATESWFEDNSLVYPILFLCFLSESQLPMYFTLSLLP